MLFDWRKFCDAHSISYITRGPNTAHNHISIHCPFCGEADTSEHLGLSLDKKRPAWGCWRSRSHRGVDPVRLIRALLGCSEEHAKSLVARGSLPELDEFSKLFGGAPREGPDLSSGTYRKQSLRMPKEFKRLGEGLYSRRFEDYLSRRGFADPLDVASTYDLRYCLTGTYSNRLLLPIYYQEQLVGWTGRDVSGRSDLRYHSLTDKSEVSRKQGYPPAPINLKQLVLWQDYVLEGGEGLVIVEGPLDALKVDYFNDVPGVVTTCLFGKPTNPQLKTLSLAARRFKWVVSALDPDAWADALPFIYELQDLSGKRVFNPKLPGGAEDPGAMSGRQVKDYIKQCQDLCN